jgi:hypothetical protein
VNNFDFLKPCDLTTPYLWIGLVRCRWDFGDGTYSPGRTYRFFSEAIFLALPSLYLQLAHSNPLSFPSDFIRFEQYLQSGLDKSYTFTVFTIEMYSTFNNR